ncbi:MAG TPA: hypothetical protein VM425_05650 [Myxococcota bacterium]|nr:hypothetical protein [Myxococcota bacterium]
MNKCDQIQRKLVSAEELTVNERRHLDDCPDCGTFFETYVSIESAAAAHRQIDESPLPASAGMRPVYRRLVLMSLSLLVCLAVVATFVARRLDSPDREAAGQRLLLLLDDVGEIADAEDSGDMQLDSDSALFATQELFEQQEQQEEDRLVLPPDYEYLEEALSNNWL